MKNIDLKVLAIVRELLHTRSVSQTAENLSLSQSAVSMNLAKLRKHFNDPLFVRTSSGMEPTPHASQLIDLLKRAEDLLQAALGHHVVFHPRSSDRAFRLHSTDIAQVTLLPKLMARLKETAPLVRIDLRRISEATPRLLESGAADVAVGFIPPMGAGFCRQSLFKDRFVCVTRRNHPRVGSTLSLEQFQSESHLAIATAGTGHGIVERILEGQGIRRHVGLMVPSFLGISSILSSSEYLAILPGQLAQHLAAQGKIKVLRLPFHVPAYVIMQHWHERYAYDPAARWLRSVIAEVFCEERGARQRSSLSAANPTNRSNSAEIKGLGNSQPVV